MATIATITPRAGFNTAFTAYNSALPIRQTARTDFEVEHAERVLAPLLDNLLAHPAPDLSAVVSKCSAIMAEYGDGEVPSYMVEGIMFDLMTLETAR